MVEVLEDAQDREDALMAFTNNLSEANFLDLVMDTIASRRSRRER